MSCRLSWSSAPISMCHNGGIGTNASCWSHPRCWQIHRNHLFDKKETQCYADYFSSRWRWMSILYAQHTYQSRTYCKHCGSQSRWPEKWFRCHSLSPDGIWTQTCASECPRPSQSTRRPHGPRSSSSQILPCSGICECSASDISTTIHAGTRNGPFDGDPKSAPVDRMWPPPASRRWHSSNRLCNCSVRMCQRIPSLASPTASPFCPSYRLKWRWFSANIRRTWRHRCVFRWLYQCLYSNRRIWACCPSHRSPHELHPDNIKSQRKKNQQSMKVQKQQQQQLQTNIRHIWLLPGTHSPTLVHRAKICAVAHYWPYHISGRCSPTK